MAASLIPGNVLTLNHQSVETSVGGWSSFGSRSTSIAQDSGQAYDGTFSVKCVRNATAGDGGMCGLATSTDYGTVTAGLNYTATCWVYCSVSAAFYWNIDWYTSGTVYISTTSGTSQTIPANTWTMLGISGTHLAPATAAKVSPFINNLSGMANGDIVYFDLMYVGIPQPPVRSISVAQQSINRSSLW